MLLCLLGASVALAAGPSAHDAAKPRRADLVVPSAAAKLATGQITVTVVASNRGRRRAAASTGAVAWKPAGKGTKAVRLKTFAVGTLAPRARRSVKVRLSVPAGSSGAYAVTVCLDVKAKIRESGGANNCRSAGTVTVPAGGALGEQQSSSAPTITSTSAPTVVGGSGSSGAPLGTGTGGTDARGVPDTSISRGPVGVTGTRSETILFDSPDRAAAFECRVDGADWVACTSPITLTGLADGLHIFEVRAGNGAGSDPTPASRTWTVDATAPETTIGGGPQAAVNATTAQFEISSSEDGGSLECRLDSGPWSFCVSPRDLTGLAPGSHTFRARATDSAGNTDATPAVRTWIVDQTPPPTTIGSGPNGVTTGPATQFGFTSEAGATFECRLDAGPWAACTSPSALTGLADGPHAFEVRATDTAGNVDASPASHTWTVDATAPDTTLTAGPSGTVADANAAFGFASADPDATFECRIEGGAWAACTSPQTYASLTDGPHTFEVRATDAVGNVDDTPASRTWTVDTTAPDTTITGGPSGALSTNAATFTFTSADAGATFQCRIDGGSFGACTSPQTYGSLGQGSHTFEVRAIDAVGNVDDTPATRTWTVDTIAPDTTITGGPAGTQTTGAASFTFTSADAGATFQCRIDAGAWGACTAPKDYTDLADGSRTFEVRAVDAVGNIDDTPASRTWVVDTAAPDTTITGGPSGTVKTNTATFSFTSADAGATFQCRLDTGSFTACASPATYDNLTDGPHTLQVRAVDPAGNTDDTPASRTWTVDAAAPETTIDSGPSNTVNTGAASFTFSSSEPGSTFECRLDTGEFSPCTSPAAFTLADGPHTLQVRAIDVVGNIDDTPASRTWTVDTVAPDTTIESGPGATDASPDAAFTFSSNEGGSSFACRLDDAAFTACASPASYSGLPEGAHTFEVQATDPAGNVDGTPASQTWTIAAQP